MVILELRISYVALSRNFACVFVEPPKQKRKKTLELFDDKDESSDLFNSVDKKSPAKLGAEPKKVKGKTPGEKTEGLFADTNNEKLEGDMI